MTHCFPCFRAISQRLTGATRSQLLQWIASVFHSGNEAHFEEQFDNRGVPGSNFDRAKTLASMDRLTGIAKALRATLVVQHDANDIAKLPAFPKSAK